MNGDHYREFKRKALNLSKADIVVQHFKDHTDEEMKKWVKEQYVKLYPDRELKSSAEVAQSVEH